MKSHTNKHRKREKEKFRYLCVCTREVKGKEVKERREEKKKVA